MPMHTSHPLSRALLVAAAALFIRISSAAAASPQPDIQQQMRDVLTGSIAAHATVRSHADPANALDSNSDAQEFARRLLLGWSASHVGAQPTRQKLQPLASESTQSPQADEDFQSTVQATLLGARASSHSS